MKLTRNEILVLIDYYNDLEYELENRIEVFDPDLFKIQTDRYKNEKNTIKSRIKELRNDLNNLQLSWRRVYRNIGSSFFS